VLGLPAEPGAVGAIMVVLGLVAAAALVLFGRRRIAAEVGAPLRSAVALATLATLATTVAAAPFVLWRVVEDIRYTSRLTTVQAEEIGADMNGLDEQVFERVRAMVPSDATYAIAVDPDLHWRQREALPKWAGFSLLPRVRVDDPARADWIVSWGVPPAELGVDVADETEIVQHDESLRWYVARVVS
jgi:hypothetical protein